MRKLIVLIVVMIFGISIVSALTVYPSPAGRGSGCMCAKEAIGTVNLYTLFGSKIRSCTPQYFPSVGYNACCLDTSGLSYGTYFVKDSSSNQMVAIFGGACCSRSSCNSLGKECGNWYDGCDGTVNCGNCLNNQTCSNGICVPQLPSNACTIETGTGNCADGSAPIFRMSDYTNAHAELPSYSNYNYKICCKDAGNSCSGNYKTILKLSSPTNAHVEEYQLTPQNYNYDVCLSAAGSVTCSYRQNCTSNELCVASISSDTNAHVAQCDYYNINVCCEICTNKITMKCATVKGPQGEDLADSCSEDVNDKACCPQNTDCVSGGTCYNQGNTKTIQGKNLVCSSGTWCPVGFKAEEDKITGEIVCVYKPKKACYDRTQKSLQSSQRTRCPFRNDQDLKEPEWWTEEKCINKDTGDCCCPDKKWNNVWYYDTKKIKVY